MGDQGIGTQSHRRHFVGKDGNSTQDSRPGAVVNDKTKPGNKDENTYSVVHTNDEWVGTPTCDC